MREKLLPKEHPDILTINYNYSLVLIKNNDYTEAEKLLQNAVKIGEKILGKDHLTIARIYNLLGKINDMTNKAFYNMALNVLDNIDLTFSTMYINTSVSICRNYVSLRQNQVAEVHLTKLFNLIQVKIGKDQNTDSCFTYLKKHLNDPNGEVIYSRYGNYDEYDILDLMAILISHFKDNTKIIEALDQWRSLSLQGVK